MAVFSIATDTGAEIYFGIKRCRNLEEKAAFSSEWLERLASMCERCNGNQFLFPDGSCLTVFMGGPSRNMIIKDVSTVFVFNA